MKQPVTLYSVNRRNKFAPLNGGGGELGSPPFWESKWGFEIKTLPP